MFTPVPVSRTGLSDVVYFRCGMLTEREEQHILSPSLSESGCGTVR